MSRPISVSLFSIILAALFFGMASVYQSCSTKEKSADLTTEEKAVQVAETYSQETYFEDDESKDNGNNLSTSNQTEVDSKGKDNVASLSANQGSSGNPVSSRKTTQETKSSSSAAYLIIAGNYLVKSNAEAMKNRLVKEGYSAAEVTVFDLSQYYTVLAGRFDNYSYAKSVSGELKSISIDNYILTKK